MWFSRPGTLSCLALSKSGWRNANLPWVLGAWAPEQADISLDPSYMAVHLFVFPLKSPELAGSRHFVGMGLAFPYARPLESCLAQRSLLLGMFKALFRVLSGLTGLLRWRKCPSTRPATMGVWSLRGGHCACEGQLMPVSKDLPLPPPPWAGQKEPRGLWSDCWLVLSFSPGPCWYVNWGMYLNL